MLSGFGLGTTAGEMAHAAFESVAFQTANLISAAEKRTGAPLRTTLTDGGPTQNDWLMQMQANLSQREVTRSNTSELSAIGAAHLAGISAGLWTVDECARLPRVHSIFLPRKDRTSSLARRESWRSAVLRSRGRAAEERPGNIVSFDSDA